jgi:hypothetical protein
MVSATVHCLSYLVAFLAWFSAIATACLREVTAGPDLDPEWRVPVLNSPMVLSTFEENAFPFFEDFLGGRTCPFMPIWVSMLAMGEFAVPILGLLSRLLEGAEEGVDYAGAAVVAEFGGGSVPGGDGDGEDMCPVSGGGVPGIGLGEDRGALVADVG